ncbi:MAG: ATP-binding protein [Gemmatimonadota bacterium]
MAFTTVPPLSASSPLKGDSPDRRTLQLCGELAEPDQRARAARELAQLLGACDLIVFLHQADVEAVLPAPGFPQTLIGGRQWQDFLQRCLVTGEQRGELPWGNGRVAVSAIALSGSVLVLIDAGADMADLRRLSPVLPLLGATMRGERNAIEAKARAQLARAAAARTAQLAAALDAVRAQLQDALERAGKTALAARAGEKWLHDLFERAPALMVTLRGPEHVFESANPVYYQLIRKNDILGKRVADVLPEIVGQDFLHLLDHVFQTGEPYLASEMPVLLDRLGEGTLDEVFLNFVYQPMFDADGRITGIFLHGVDVTAQVRARQQIEQQATELEELQAETEAMNDELQHRNEELAQRTQEADEARGSAEEANHVKSAFLATMSHELRTPLNAIIGYADLLDAEVAGSLTAGQREQLARVTMAARHLLQIIEEILTFSRLEARREAVRNETVDLRQLSQDTALLVEPLARLKSLKFSCDLPESLQTQTDPGKVRQVLLNLLSNAVKFTDRGEVALQLRRAGPDILLRVRDTGFGIPAEQLQRIFEPFLQVEQSPGQRRGGTGLGLAVAAQLTHLLGGELTVESTLGSGSVFTMRIPFVPPETEYTAASG